MNIRFYMTPGSCSTGIHILLEEAGLVFEAYLVNLMACDQHKPEYLALNPKATIPTLVLQDGTALTDFLSIALWIARAHPRRKLLAQDLMQELAVIEKLNYVVNHIHGAGFTRIFTTDKYASDPAAHAAVQEEGRRIVAESFRVVEGWLVGRDFLGEAFCIADAALFYVEFWASRTGMNLPEHCMAHYQRMLTRPSVQLVLAEEGYASVLRQQPEIEEAL